MKVHNLLVTGSLTSGGENIGSISSSVATINNSQDGRLSSLETTSGSIISKTGSYATTGSNVFVGDQTISGSIIPSVNGVYDLGSSTHEFRHLYLSSASLYIDGTKVLGSTTQELQITTDTGQSFKILEAGSDTITLQSADGNITLATSGGGDVILDPTNGVVALKGTTTLYAGNRILSSDGNAIQFGNSVTMTGSLIVTGYIETQELRTTYISSSILYRSGSTKFGDELSDTHEFTGSLLVSGSLITSNIGVGGTSSGTYGKLSVFGGMSIKDDFNGKLEIGRYSSGAPNSYIKLGPNSNSLRFTNNTDVADILELTNSGNLGLGVTPNSWSSPFNVIQGGTYGQSIGFQTNGPDIKLGTNNYYNGSGYIYTNTGNGSAQLNIGGNSGFQFNTAPSGTSGNSITFTSVMSITNGGVVGIGVTNPSSAYLDVIGTSTSTNSLQLRSGNTDTGTTSNQILFGYNGTESYRHAIKTRHMSDATPGNSIDFYVWKYGTNSAGTIGTQHVMSLNGGNVGIGITTPTALLHLSSNTPYIYIDDTSTSGTKNRFQMVVGDVGSTQSTNFGFNNVSGTSLTDVLTVNELGRVGIGTTSPSQKLSIGTITGGGTATSTPTCITLDDTFGNNTIGTNLKLKIFQDNSTNRYGLGVSDSLLEIVSGNGGSIGFFTNGANEKARLNGNGQLSLPYQPVFSAYAPGGGPNTRTTGAFGGYSLTRINRGSHYNTSNGRFTAPIAGAYEFIFSMLWRQTNDTGSGEISLGLNGSNISGRGLAYTYGGAANDFHDQTFVRAILNLAAGDYVTGWIHSSGNSTGNWYYGDGLGHFSGYLLG